MPPTSARNVTAAAGLQPASMRGFMNAPDMPNVPAAATATISPRVVRLRMGGRFSRSE
jgi:hypothetical protein